MKTISADRFSFSHSILARCCIQQQQQHLAQSKFPTASSPLMCNLPHAFPEIRCCESCCRVTSEHSLSLSPFLVSVRGMCGTNLSPTPKRKPIITTDQVVLGGWLTTCWSDWSLLGWLALEAEVQSGSRHRRGWWTFSLRSRGSCRWLVRVALL